MMELKEVKKKAKKELGQIPGVQGFGLGDGTLRVYVRNSETKKKVPHKFHDVEVECVVEGDIVAAKG